MNREFISLNSEIIKNLREIKLYNYINHFFNEERIVLSKYTKIHTYFILITKLPGMSNEILVIFSLGLILLINNYFGEANLSLLSKVAFLGYGGLKINNYLNKIIEHRMKILSNFPSFKSVINKLETKGFKSGNKIYKGHIKNISFKNVSFSYSDKKVIERVNLSIKRGQKVFIYGDSGVGKSTFLDLLSKNLKPTSGKITINNLNLLDLNIKKFRESISYIPQEPFFSGHP